MRRPLLELELEYSRGIVGVGGWLVFGMVGGGEFVGRFCCVRELFGGS